MDKIGREIHVCNEELGVVSMHNTKAHALTSARELLNKEPEIKELFVCDWMNRFEPVKLSTKDGK